MSNRINDPYQTEFELDDRISFLYNGDRITGRVVRVYASRFDYHGLVS